MPALATHMLVYTLAAPAAKALVVPRARPGASASAGWAGYTVTAGAEAHVKPKTTALALPPLPNSDGGLVATGGGGGGIKVWNTVDRSRPPEDINNGSATPSHAPPPPRWQRLYLTCLCVTGAQDGVCRVYQALSSLTTPVPTPTRPAAPSAAASVPRPTVWMPTCAGCAASPRDPYPHWRYVCTSGRCIGAGPCIMTLPVLARSVCLSIWGQRGNCNASHNLALPTAPGAVLSVAYSPDGQEVASGVSDNTIRIWLPQLGVAVVTIPMQPLDPGHTGPVHRASGSHAPFPTHTGPVNSVAWSPDGSNVVSASGDGSAK
eukprot:gene4308-4590_t